MESKFNQLAAETEDDGLTELFKACSVGNVKWLGEFVINGGNLSSATDKCGKNALHYCVKCVDQAEPINSTNIFDERDRFRCTRILVKVQPELLKEHDHDGLTPIHHAVLNDDLDLLHVLLEFHPDLGQCTIESFTEETVKSFPISNIAIPGRTVIHLSVIRSNPDILRLLLLQPNASDAINKRDFQGATALHYAVQLPSPTSEEVIALISRVPGVDFNLSDKHERTPILWAATIGAAQALKELLKNGAKLSITDENGLSALHCASSRGNLAVIETILSWTALANSDEPSRLSSLVDVLDKDGCSPLFYSVTVGNKDVTNALLDAGADVNIKDLKGRTVAHCLARLSADRCQDVESSVFSQLTELLNKGLNPWQPNGSGTTPLHEACLLRNSAFIVALSDLTNFGTWVNYRNPQGHTPLHLVVATSWSQDARGLQIVECILKHGGEVNATTLLPGGKAVTPLDLAVMNEKEENVRMGMMSQLLMRYWGKTFDEMRQMSKPSVSSMDGNASECVDSKHEPNEKKEEMEKPQNITQTKQTRPTERPTIDRQSSNVVKRSSKHTSTNDRQVKNVGVSASTSQHNKTCQSILSYRTVSVQCETLRRPQHSVQINTETTSGDCSTSEMVQINFACDSMLPREKTIKSRPPVANHASSRRTTHSSLDNNDTALKETWNKPVIRKEPRKLNKVKTKTPMKSNTKPYSEIHIEKDLPVALQRFLSKRDESISLMTGRRRMPKPMQSPYLTPVVPDIFLFTSSSTSSHPTAYRGSNRLRAAVAIRPQDNFSRRPPHRKSRSTCRPLNADNSGGGGTSQRLQEVRIHSLQTVSHPCSAMGGELTPDTKDYPPDAAAVSTYRSDRKQSGARVIKWVSHTPPV